MTCDRLIIAIRLILLSSFLACSGNGIALFGLLPYLWLIYPVLGASSPCGDCIGGTQNTTSIQFDVAGVTNGTCSSCSVLNATYILSFASVCSYSLNSTKNPGCGIPATINYLHTFVWSIAPTYTIASLGLGISVTWVGSVSTPYDCSDDTGLYGSANPTTATDTRCTWTAATATMTA